MVFFFQKKKSKFEEEKKPRKKFSKLKFGFFHMDGSIIKFIGEKKTNSNLVFFPRKKKTKFQIWFFSKKKKFGGEKKTKKNLVLQIWFFSHGRIYYPSSQLGNLISWNSFLQFYALSLCSVYTATANWFFF